MSFSSPAGSPSLPYPQMPLSPDALAAKKQYATPASAQWLNPLNQLSKRIIDILGAAAGLILLAPITIPIAILVKLTSKGPVFFRQTHVGHQGRLFQILKFRTMRADAHHPLKEIKHLKVSHGGDSFKTRPKPRPTPAGLFLRHSSLDQLPLLWNVLVGDMSLVGPRPLPLRDSQILAQIDPKGCAGRLQMPPGLTGFHHIKGRCETDLQHMISTDLDYLRSWSPRRDLLIILHIFRDALTCRGN